MYHKAEINQPLLKVKTMKNMKLNLRCFEAGKIEIQGFTPEYKTDYSGAHSAYQVSNPESLFEVAKGYSWVKRPSGKTVKGKSYTLRMAANDFKNA